MRLQHDFEIMLVPLKIKKGEQQSNFRCLDINLEGNSIALVYKYIIMDHYN